jgi:alcohol dehydrogenase (cytochrome c)
MTIPTRGSSIAILIRPTARAVLTAIGLVSGLVVSTQASADGDAAAGKTVFANQCSSCHTTVVGKNGFGPSLAEVVGRKAGGLAGFTYSPAMAQAGLIWDAKNLDEFLTSSTVKVPGTSMPVSVPNPTDRANVIAYLETLGRASAAPASAPAALPQGPTQDELPHAAQDKQNWLRASKDYTGARFVDLRQITPANAGQLRAACIYRSNVAGSTQTNPLVYKGVMYFTIDKAIVAIDAATCRERWTYNWEQKGSVLSPTNRGVALKDGRLVRGTADGYLIAVNMADGSLLWSRKTADAKTSQYLSMPPLIYGDLVIYGPAGADWGAKNWIGAFNLTTGEQVWRFNLIPDAGEPGADTWTDPQSRAWRRQSVDPIVSRRCSRRTLRARRQSCTGLLPGRAPRAPTCTPTQSWRSTSRPASCFGTSSSVPTTPTTAT